MIPACQPEKWQSRPQQILGFRQFADQLASRLSTLNPDYFDEVQACMLGKPMPGRSGELEPSQRFYFILRPVFGGSHKCMAVIRLFDAQEGTHNGFLLLSRLAKEYSLCTMTEAIFFKSCIANFKLGRQSSVRDSVQLLESEMYLYEKLVQTITDDVLRKEMFLQDGEKMRLLMLNLPKNVSTFLQLHGGDSYSSQRDAAIRWHERTELISQDFSKMPSLSLSALHSSVDEQDGQGVASAFPNSKPKAAPKKDLSSIECWKCGRKGHYARDCRSSDKQSNFQNNTSRGSSKGSPSKSSSQKTSKGKGSGKSSGKNSGKKGLRAAELSEEAGEQQTENEEGESNHQPESEAWSEVGEEEELRLTSFVAVTPQEQQQHEQFEAPPQLFLPWFDGDESFCLHGSSDSRSLSIELQVARKQSKKFCRFIFNKKGHCLESDFCSNFADRCRSVSSKSFSSKRVGSSAVFRENSLQKVAVSSSRVNQSSQRRVEAFPKEILEVVKPRNALKDSSISSKDRVDGFVRSRIPALSGFAPALASSRRVQNLSGSFECCFQGFFKRVFGRRSFLKSDLRDEKGCISEPVVPIESFRDSFLQSDILLHDPTSSHCMSLHGIRDDKLHADPLFLHDGALCPTPGEAARAAADNCNRRASVSSSRGLKTDEICSRLKENEISSSDQSRVHRQQGFQECLSRVEVDMQLKRHNVEALIEHPE